MLPDYTSASTCSWPNYRSTSAFISELVKRREPDYRSLLLEFLIEPCAHALNPVLLVFRVGKHMAFMLVDDQFRLCAQCLQRMPEFIGLRSRTFAVTVAHKDQRGRFSVLDKGDGRAFGVNLGIFINR